MSANSWDLAIGDVLERVAAPCVFSDRHIVIVDDSGSGDELYIFEDGSEPNGIVDLRFLLRAEVDAFGITASLDVEDPFVGPDMLVVSDQKTVSFC